MEDANDGGISVALVGDLMLRTPLADLPGAAHAGFRAAVTELGRSDVRVANLEMPLSTGGYKVPKHSNLRSDPAIADDVRVLGIDAVTLANNHLLDYGPPAMFDTLAACDRAGLLRCGAGADLDEAGLPR
jgi:poly-gamma-glutamate synthesis protein (capsule biosynthesis protein)